MVNCVKYSKLCKSMFIFVVLMFLIIPFFNCSDDGSFNEIETSPIIITPEDGSNIIDTEVELSWTHDSSSKSVSSYDIFSE